MSPTGPGVTPGGRRVYLSSRAAGWSELLAVAVLEPVALDDCSLPAAPGASLSLCAGGPRRRLERQANGRWTALNLEHGDLLLHTDHGRAGEMRWRALSSAPMRTLHLGLSWELLHRTAQEMSDADPAHSSLIDRPVIQDPLLTHIGFALWRELEQRSPSGKLYVDTAAQMLAAHLWRHYSSAAVRTPRETAQRLSHRQVTRVADYVMACIDSDLSLNALARVAGLSPYHFARMFRATTGHSPHQFVLRQRVETARRLLRETDLPLVLVATRSGFGDQSHLTRVFKRAFGITPGRYRASASSYNGPQD